MKHQKIVDLYYSEKKKNNKIRYFDIIQNFNLKISEDNFRKIIERSKKPKIKNVKFFRKYYNYEIIIFFCFVELMNDKYMFPTKFDMVNIFKKIVENRFYKINLSNINFETIKYFFKKFKISYKGKKKYFGKNSVFDAKKINNFLKNLYDTVLIEKILNNYKKIEIIVQDETGFGKNKFNRGWSTPTNKNQCEVEDQNNTNLSVSVFANNKDILHLTYLPNARTINYLNEVTTVKGVNNSSWEIICTGNIFLII
jgi:hypothetical protein